MTNRKKTKRALLASVLSMLLCVTMLIGSTFAWFTDNDSTNVNTIEAGELDIKFQMKSGENWVDASDETLNFVKAANAADGDQILWEPGVTYQLPAVKLVNDGNLALKFKLLVNGFDGDWKLAEVLEVLVGGQALLKADGTAVTLADLKADSDGLAHGVLLPFNKSLAAGEDSSYVKVGETSEYQISLHMAEKAGNDYQQMKIENLALTVVATQYTYEYDSDTNQYDADAVYPITNADALDEAMNDSTITDVLIGGGKYTETVTIRDGKTVTSEAGTFDTSGDTGYSPALEVQNGASLVLNGGTYAAAGMQVINAQSQASSVTINGGTYRGNVAVWNCGTCEVTINGGTFNTWALAVTDNSNAPITVNGGTFNLGKGGIDAATGCAIVINGGTFNVDPTNWLGEGHTVTQSNGLWTVK